MAEVAPLYARFDKDESDKWAKKIEENYNELV